MLIHLPSSRASLRVRLSAVDVALAAVSPLAALYLRNGDLVLNDDWIMAGSYSVVSLACSLIAFRVFAISGTIPRYITVNDLLDVAKAVSGGELMTAIVLFTVTRLEGIPRSVPAIHALILATGLVAYRGLANVADKQRCDADQPPRGTNENLILIGLNDWSVFLMKYLRRQSPQWGRVIAVLDEDPRWFGRAVNGVLVFGPPAQLDAVVEEFATHGLRTDRVVVGCEPSSMSAEAVAEVRGVCAQRDLDLVFSPYPHAPGSAEANYRSVYEGPDRLQSSQFLSSIRPSPYFRFKRVIDVVVALTLILTLLPLLIIAALIILLDVGSPVLFWQQRAGQGGRPLQLYKLRTLRPPFDRNGQRIPEEQRLSRIGRLLRETRLDELPQLINVLVGDMSLIGPRPLLPRDQPPNSALRLTVRPGITGWAQVNGGVSLSPTEKDALDVWYIRNASLWLDLRIIVLTFISLVKSDRRCEEAVAECRARAFTDSDDVGRAFRLIAAACSYLVGTGVDRSHRN